MARGQLTSSSFAKHSDDSEGGHSVNYPTSATIMTDEEFDALQLKIKAPKLEPKPKNKLTSEEAEHLDKELVIAKGLLEKFKDLLRQKGLDVEHYFAYKSEGRIKYSMSEEHLRLFKSNRLKPAHHREREVESANRLGMRPR